MTVPARPAATVVLVRRSAARPDGWETYLLRRSTQSPVHADLWVFPGGTLRAEDRGMHDQPALIGSEFSADAAHSALSRPPGGPAATPKESMAYFVAAARELFEEAGILLFRRPGNDHPLVQTALNLVLGDLAVGITHLRRDIEERGGFGALLAKLGLRLALEDLVYYAHWITPEALPQRFDTRFFLAMIPAGQEASPSSFEMAEGAWLAADDALARSKEGTLPLHFATLSHLRRLAPYPGLEELLDFARTKPVTPVMPSTSERAGRIVPTLPPELEGVW